MITAIGWFIAFVLLAYLVLRVIYWSVGSKALRWKGRSRL